MHYVNVVYYDYEYRECREYIFTGDPDQKPYMYYICEECCEYNHALKDECFQDKPW